MIRDTAERAREDLAKTIHRKNDSCHRDGAEESWDSGYECACFEIADAILKSEWLTQIQAEARLEEAKLALQTYQSDGSTTKRRKIFEQRIAALAQALQPATGDK